VDHRAISVIRLAAAALLVFVAAVACTRHDGAPVTAGGTPAARSLQADLPTLAPTPGVTDSTAPSQTAGLTTNQVVDLSDLEDLLNEITDSLSGGNAGPSGGE